LDSSSENGSDGNTPDASPPADAATTLSTVCTITQGATATPTGAFDPFGSVSPFNLTCDNLGPSGSLAWDLCLGDSGVLSYGGCAFCGALGAAGPPCVLGSPCSAYVYSYYDGTGFSPPDGGSFVTARFMYLGTCE
jgi:hypothetical protein